MTHGEDTPSAANAAAARLNLPYTLANFRLLLAEGAQSSSRYTHADIAAWAGAFWWRYTIWPAEPEKSVSPVLQAAADLAQEIEMEFDAYVGDRYSLPGQPRVAVAQMHLPSEWFVDWLERLSQITPPTVSE